MSGKEETTMKVIKTLLVTALVLIAAALIFIYSGVYNVAADDPHARPVRWVLETTRQRSVDRRADEVVTPDDLSAQTRVEKGAKNYQAMCQMCHLAPGVEPTPVHRGLNPAPPRLAEEATGMPPARLFWIVKHGFKMTGMPAWGESHSDEELWDIVAFLQKLPGMSAEEYKQLTHAKSGSGQGH